MNRYFKIIGNSDDNVRLIEEDFTVGKIYKESSESDGSNEPALVGNLGEWFWVGRKNIKEVSEQEYLDQLEK